MSWFNFWSQNNTGTAHASAFDGTAHASAFGETAHASAFDESANSMFFPPSNCIALTLKNMLRKNDFCNTLLGLSDKPLYSQLEHLRLERLQISASLGYEPLSPEGNIQECLLHKTKNISKDKLYEYIDRLYSPTLKERADPKNPLCDKNGNAISTKQLSPKEQLEIAQINLLLRNPKLVVIDLSSTLMEKAIQEGFQLSRELFETGKTILVLLSPHHTILYVENLLKQKFTDVLELL